MDKINYSNWGKPISKNQRGVPFKDLFHLFISGTPIKRKCWRGYWKYSPFENDVEMHLKDGTMKYMSNTDNLAFTLAAFTADDWEVATNENCDIEVK